MATQVALPATLGPVIKGQAASMAYILDASGKTLCIVTRPDPLDTEHVAAWVINAINLGGQHA
jgi:hypothetical protein